ncbi:MAG TPA: type VI secretion system baseplate subunit TssF [Ignavibacteriaceae bacterium]|nr:type VI secretion system baseplate subunit TssF [Ignavibacteriaceae bacterium]
MSTDKYFEREYNFLQTAGEEFSKKHPTLGSRLHMSERERKDPFVERLYEGFAFLAGRIHERLDDEFPEIAGGILEMLFPNMLKPFPSCAILQAKYKPGSITGPVLIKRGSEIQTQTGKYKVKYKVLAGPSEGSRITEKDEPAEFIFSTTQDLIVRPIKIENIIVEEIYQGNSSLILKFQLERNVDYNSLNMDSLQLYLHGSASIKYNLLLYLTKYVASLSVKESDDKKSQYQKIDNYNISIPEFSNKPDNDINDYSILPYSKQTFPGFRLLQEYFSFPEKFFFVEINGLQNFKSSGESNSFEIKIDFTKKLLREKWPSVNNILIHCSPIVNLFSRSTEEVAVTQRLPEYYIIPDLSRRKSREIYYVDKITGISESKFEQYKYIPITSHDILETSDPEYNYKRFYSTFRRTQQHDMAESYIRLFGPSMEMDSFPKETLSIEATLFNGFLPSAYLEAGTIKEPINFPSGIEASNITIPQEMLDCPDRKNYLWSLIAHLSVSYSTLADEDSFKNILNLYNWTKAHNHPNKKRINGITKIHKPKLVSKVINQSLIRGIEFHIEVDPKEYEQGEGEIHLMGTIINSFLSQYVTINSYIFLKITETGTSKEYKWQPITGEMQIV